MQARLALMKVGAIFIPATHYFQSNSSENGQILSVVIISIQQMPQILRLTLGGRSEVTLKTSGAILKIPPRKFSVLCDRAKNRLLWHLLCFEILLDVFLKEVQWYPLCVTNSGGWLVAQSGISSCSASASGVNSVFLNSESELFRETLRKQWLHLENMIASSVLIFMLFEAIFILVFVCSWWKRWKDLRTSWIPLRE